MNEDSLAVTAAEHGERGRRRAEHAMPSTWGRIADAAGDGSASAESADAMRIAASGRTAASPRRAALRFRRRRAGAVAETRAAIMARRIRVWTAPGRACRRARLGGDLLDLLEAALRGAQVTARQARSASTTPTKVRLGK